MITKPKVEYVLEITTQCQNGQVITSIFVFDAWSEMETQVKDCEDNPRPWRIVRVYVRESASQYLFGDPPKAV